MQNYRHQLSVKLPCGVCTWKAETTVIRARYASATACVMGRTWKAEATNLSMASGEGPPRILQKRRDKGKEKREGFSENSQKKI